jgi:hypothetical protein
MLDEPILYLEDFYALHKDIIDLLNGIYKDEVTGVSYLNMQNLMTAFESNEFTQDFKYYQGYLLFPPNLPTS